MAHVLGDGEDPATKIAERTPGLSLISLNFNCWTLLQESQGGWGAGRVFLFCPEEGIESHGEEGSFEPALVKDQKPLGFFFCCCCLFLKKGPRTLTLNRKSNWNETSLACQTALLLLSVAAKERTVLYHWLKDPPAINSSASLNCQSPALAHVQAWYRQKTGWEKKQRLLAWARRKLLDGSSPHSKIA